jgi:MFS family permease
MVAAAAVAQYMSAPGQSYSVAAFKDPMREGLGISETNYSLAYGTATIVSACLLPFVGRLIDRFGARVMLPLIGIGLGTACLLMSCVESLPGLYLGFMLVRSIGQGALSLVSIWLVGEWFARRRGMATAIAGLGGGLSVMTIPLINNWFIQNYGWQTGWLALSVMVSVSLIIPGWFIIRDRPEEMGLHPDGVDPKTTSKPGHSMSVPTEESWTVAEVVCDITFWKLLAVPVTSGLLGTGLVFHQVNLMGVHGLSPQFALGLMSVQAGFATLLTFPAGWATDRMESRKLLSLAMLSLAVAIVLMLSMPSVGFVIPYAFLLGFHGSIMRSTAQVVWINFYGRAHQGAVRGAAWSAMIFASAIGPIPLAYSVDRYGTYTPALIAFLSLPLLAATAVWTVRPPVRK